MRGRLGIDRDAAACAFFEIPERLLFLLEQALQNLAMNAVKYNRAEGLVRLTLRSEAGVVSISVGNTGPGIPDADRPRVFERFFRSDPARSRNRVSGAGLGLSLSREIIRAHGGDLVLGRVEPDWTEFVATLPLAPAEEKGTPASSGN